MIVECKYLTICLFVLRIGKKCEDWKIAYGVVYPAVEKMNSPIVSGSTDIGTCEYGRLSIRKIFLSSERDEVLDIFEDLSNGNSLKASFVKYRIDVSKFDFDVKYTQSNIKEDWGLEAIGTIEKLYTKKVTMLYPLQLIEKNGKIASDAEKAIVLIENYLRKQTGIEFNTNTDHVGNLEIIIKPEVDESGKPLVRLIWDKDAPWGLNLIVDKKLLMLNDEIILNVKSIINDRVIDDFIDKVDIYNNDDIERIYHFEKCPDRIYVKIWKVRENKSIVLTDTGFVILKQINVSIGLQQPVLKVDTVWLDDIRKNISSKNINEIDRAKTIERTSLHDHTIGKNQMRRLKRREPLKVNDEFFPKGWDHVTQEHGMLSFLEWFKNKAKGTSNIFLQDPYFEDVALFFIATAEIDSNYTVLTQTYLKTNSDSTYTTINSDNSGRRNKIIETIKSNPQLFGAMKLVIKDVPVNNNVLHDRYLVFSYGDRVEAYTLSNSLQGATKKHPLLVTQIGDIAFNKLSKYIEEFLNREDIETIYNYIDNKYLSTIKSEFADIADVGFWEWLNLQKNVMLDGKVSHILDDIRSWRTYDRLSTFGQFLASVLDKEVDQILDFIVRDLKNDTFWLYILKDYILKGHYSTYPVGYIGSPFRSFRYPDITSLLGMSYKNIVDSSNLYWLENIFCERYSFRVYGQYYAARLLLKLSIEEYISIIKLLKPTLLKIKSDKTITPCYKVTSMMLQALIEYDYLTNSNEVKYALISDNDEEFRGIGCLMYLLKFKENKSECEEFLHLIDNDEELIRSCHVALEIIKQIEIRDIFYNKLKDIFIKKADADFFTNILITRILRQKGSVEDKVEYIEKIVIPLIHVGFIDRLCLSRNLIEKIYYDCILGRQYLTDRILPECLYTMDGDLQLLLEYAKNEVYKFNEKLKSIVIKDQERIYEAGQKCIKFQSLLKSLIDKYADSHKIEEIKIFYNYLNDLLYKYNLSC